MGKLRLKDERRFLIFAYPVMARSEKEFCFSIRASSVCLTWSPVIVGWFVKLDVQEEAGVKRDKWAKQLLLGKN